jgi:hypothetical protein
MVTHASSQCIDIGYAVEYAQYLIIKDLGWLSLLLMFFLSVMFTPTVICDLVNVDIFIFGFEDAHKSFEPV